MKKYTVCLLACLGLAGTIVHAAQDIPQVPVAEVACVSDFQERSYPGRTVSIAQVNITSRVNGEITKVNFKNGSFVKKGDILFELDPIKYQAAVKNAEAQVAEYKAKLDYAEKSYNRNQKLSGVKAVSEDDLESSFSARNAFAATLAAAEANVVSAKDDLAHCIIKAPINGRISSAAFTEGNYVTANSGALAVLIQTAPIRVRFSMSSRDFLSMFDGKTDSICANGAVSLALADGRPFPEQGIVEYVENTMDDSTDTITVFALFPNAEKSLLPGGTVRVTLKNKAGAKHPAVPLSALMQDVKGTYVWVVKAEGMAEKRYIERGLMQNDYLIVRSGLKEGELIVTDGTHKVRPGRKFQAVRH